MSHRQLIVLLGCMALAPLAATAEEAAAAPQGPPPGAAERWAAHDTDGDGAISLAEAQANAPRLARDFATFDADGDGKITRAEMHTVRSETREERQARAQERYRETDTNGDGAIDLAEAQAGMPRAAQNFGAIDADGNGQLTREEMRSFMQAHRGEGMHRGQGMQGGQRMQQGQGSGGR
jgi:Ca2+-binding EF-hand superfamily protein